LGWLLNIQSIPGLGRISEGDSLTSRGSAANFADRSAWCTFAGNGFGGEHVMIEFKGSHFERDVILWAVRWYVAYPVSHR
jgi:hypothetical protein